LYCGRVRVLKRGAILSIDSEISMKAPNVVGNSKGFIHAPKYMGLINQWWKLNQCKHRELREKSEGKNNGGREREVSL